MTSLYNIILKNQAARGMGWFFSSDNTPKKQGQGDQQRPEVHSSFYSYSSSRACQTDPQDSQFMICRDTIKDGNGTRVNETRVPVQGAHHGLGSWVDAGAGEQGESLGKVLEQGMFNQFSHMIEDLNSMFRGFSSVLDNSLLSHSPVEEGKNALSVSTVRSCRSDPQDPQFMICRETTRDPEGEKVKQTRVPANYGTPFDRFGHFLTGIEDSGRILNNRFNRLDEDLSQDFERIGSIFMPFFSFMDPLAFQNQPGDRRSTTKPANNSTQKPTKYYFDSSAKDYDIKDL